MVLFKSRCSLSFRFPKYIYIPLWSYSNYDAPGEQALYKQIYIPLWSYSNMPGLLKILQTLQIYIPLWSYSNLASIKVATMYWKFTFHYGPIQIVRFSLLLLACNIFTFHYGPIQMVLQYLQNYVEPYLHSTMVLFKSCFSYYGDIFLNNLHSTMVLFK